MILWGINVPVVKLLVTDSPLLITSVRLFIGAIFLLIISWKMNTFRKLSKKELLLIFQITLFNVFLHHAFMGTGTSQTSSINTSLIMGSSPIIIALLAYFVFKQKVSKSQISGIIICLVGVYLAIVYSNNTVMLSANIGDFLVLLSIISQAVSFFMISKIDKSLHLSYFTGLMFLIGSISMFLVALITETDKIYLLSNNTPQFWILMIFSGGVATGIGHLLYNLTIPLVGVSKSAIFINLNTIFSLVAAFFILNERITLIQIIGMILIIIGVFLGSGFVEKMRLDFIERRKAIEVNNRSS